MKEMPVNKYLLPFLIVVLLAVATAATAQTATAKQTAPAPGSQPALANPAADKGQRAPDIEMPAVKLQFLVSKYQGEKKISSVPYLISTNANQSRPTSLRMSARLAVPIMSPETPSAPSFRYEDIGTSIDCSVQTSSDAKFRVEVTLSDASVYMSDQAPTNATATPHLNGIPTFRNFKVTNILLLKDGQTSQMTSAADPVTGEVMRVDVTLTVSK